MNNISAKRYVDEAEENYQNRKERRNISTTYSFDFGERNMSEIEFWGLDNEKNTREKLAVEKNFEDLKLNVQHEGTSTDNNELNVWIQ